MRSCTFFGHRDCPETIKPKLREVLVDLITNHDVDMYYVGHQVQFDAYVHSELKKLEQEYPRINYAVVLAYMPGKKTEYDDLLRHDAPGGNRVRPPTLCHLLAQQLDAQTIRLRRHLHHPLLRRRISACRKSKEA